MFWFLLRTRETMFKSKQNRNQPNGFASNSKLTEYMMLLLATGGVLLNVMYLLDDPIMHGHADQNYQPNVELLHAAMVVREKDQSETLVFVQH